LSQIGAFPQDCVFNQYKEEEMTMTPQTDTVSSTRTHSNTCDGTNKKRRVDNNDDVTSITDDNDNRYNNYSPNEENNNNNNNNNSNCQLQEQQQQPIIIPIIFPNDGNDTDKIDSQHGVPQWTMIELNGELRKPLCTSDCSQSNNTTAEDLIPSYELGSLQVINSKVSHFLLYCPNLILQFE
jgi:hypothetical protein